MKYRNKLNILVLGGALITGAFFIGIQAVTGYNQSTTHPALTSEAVKLYNFNFLNNKLSEEDKRWLMRGSTDEDAPPRWLNHFYDPVHNQGWIGYTTSKEWAMNSAKQQSFGKVVSGNLGSIGKSIDESAYGDYSYERAIQDYARGNRKRAMIAMGHVMHLLEDANVPEHTRGDTHIPIPGSESPYEVEMAKWNPANLDSAASTYNKNIKPVLLNNLGSYFDEIAGYSNGYFFSEDTIESSRFANPRIVKTKKYSRTRNWFFAVGLDKNGQEFNLALLNVRIIRNLWQINSATLSNKEIGSLILDDYWARLSKDFVAHGAGVLKLFMDQAEEARRKYVEERSGEMDLASKLMALFGIYRFDNKRSMAEISDITGIGNVSNHKNSDNDTMMLHKVPYKGDALASKDAIVINTSPLEGDGLRNNNNASPLPIATLPLAIARPSPDTGQTSSLVNSLAIINQSSPRPIAYSATAYSSSPSATPSASLTQSVSPSVSPALTPAPSLSPSALHSPSSAPTPMPVLPSSSTTTPPPTALPIANAIPGKVVINEIAWMGTGNGATLSNDEWLELYNPTSSPVNVGGWRLKSLTDNSPNIVLASRTVDPSGFLLLERTNDKVISDIAADQIYTGNLKDEGEVLELRDRNGDIVDVVGDQTASVSPWYAGDKTTRSSMERIDPLKPGSDKANWATNNGIMRNGFNSSGGAINGTPKAPNSVHANNLPDAITDLQVDPISFYGRIKLVWSAPHYTDSSVTALSYELRYASHSFETDMDWTGASRVASSSLPLVVGSFGALQSGSFDILDFNKDYYFAIKTLDGHSWSKISNIAKYNIKSAIFDGSRTFEGPAKPSISWQFQAPQTNYIGQPVIAPDGTIYFGAPYQEDRQKPRIYAVNQDGRELWHQEVSVGDPSVPIVSVDSSVYFGQLDPGSQIYSFDRDGNRRWQFGVGDRVNGVSLDPDGDIFFTSENSLINKLAANGRPKWQITDPRTFGSLPVVWPNQDLLVAINGGGLPQFSRLKAEDGLAVWNKSSSASSAPSSFTPTYDPAEDKFYASTPNYGEILEISSDGQINQKTIDYLIGQTTSITIVDDLLIFGADINKNQPASGSAVFAVNKKDKSVAWRFPVKSRRIIDRITSDMSGNLYFSTGGGELYSIDKNGQKRWSIDLGVGLASYPALGPRGVFAAVGNRLVKIGDDK